MDAYQILVIVLSVMLVILLIMSAIFIALLIKVLKQVRRLTDKADHVIDNVESASDFFRKSVESLAVGRFISGFVKAVKDRKQSHKGER